MVRKSERTCDIVLEEFEEDWGSVARKVVRSALKIGVMRAVQRDASGPKKTFVRFAVDRQRLLRGQGFLTKDATIDGFWDSLVAG